MKATALMDSACVGVSRRLGRRWFQGMLLIASVVAWSGCAGMALTQRSHWTRGLLKQARDAGAYRCAPRQLAIAEANAEFAERELDAGNYFRAKEHLAVADAEAREAREVSLSEACVGKPVAAPVAAPTAQDRDGDGVPDAVDKCPADPEDKDNFQDEDGCPDPDNDADGVPDTKDKCPMDPEDKDNFQDDDGCPDPDNDADGILDEKDKCPNEAEDKDGFEDEDGCPDPDNDHDGILDAADKCPNQAGPPGTGGCPETFSLIRVTDDKIEIKQTIFFETAKARIQPRSFPLLEEVASAIKARPTMRLRIEGHTDSRGKRATNIRLSQQRADAVRAHIIGLGVTPDRLESKGFGPDQPLETNKTAAGRERNRRVEFVITQK